MSRIRVTLSLPLGDKIRLLAASVTLFAIWGGTGLFSFGRFRRALLRVGAVGASVVPGDPSPTRVAWAVDAADRHLPGDRTCLVRSLTAETLLRTYGYEPTHRIGVDRDDDTVEAHSWIEYDDAVLIGHVEDLSKFEPLPPLESERP